MHLILLAAALAIIGVGCKGLSKEEQTAIKPITLEYWSVFTEPEGVRDLIEKYQARHPQVKINFRRLRFDEYEKELLNALAEDRGPDIVSLHHEWLSEYKAKLAPQPADVTVPTVVYKKGGGGIIGDQEPQVEKVLLEPTRLYTIKKLENTFVSAVFKDVVLLDEEGVQRIYGLPLSFDTLQMFYNRELLDKAGIAEPPKTWNEFVESIKKLRQIDSTTGEIKQAAAGLGQADNVDRAADILMLLMKQNGAILKSEDGDPRFDLMPYNLSRATPPGAEALAFYTDFSNPSKNDVYTWNKNMPTGLEMFSRGNLAYFFGYSYHIGELLASAPKLNYGIAPVPQLNEEPVNMANYWVEAVIKKSKQTDAAWDFLYFASQEKNVEKYLKTALRPTALRSLVKKQLEDEELEVIAPFVGGVLTAIEWYSGNDYKAAERAVLSMIRRVNEQDVEPGSNVYLSVVRDAAHQVRSTR